MEKLKFPVLLQLVLINLSVVCQAKDIKHGGKTLGSEKSYILLFVCKAADDGSFPFKMYALKYIRTAFLKPRDPVTGDSHKSRTCMSYSPVTNNIRHQRESKTTSFDFQVCHLHSAYCYTSFHKNV
jgi:hypothetical protein